MNNHLTIFIIIFISQPLFFFSLSLAPSSHHLFFHHYHDHLIITLSITMTIFITTTTSLPLLKNILHLKHFNILRKTILAS